MCSKPSAMPTVAAMPKRSSSAVTVWTLLVGLVSDDMGIIIPCKGALAAGSERVSDEDVEQNEGGGAPAGYKPEPLLDEVPDGLPITAQQPGKEQEPRPARHDRRQDEPAERKADDAGQDRHHLDRRKMR